MRPAAESPREAPEERPAHGRAGERDTRDRGGRAGGKGGPYWLHGLHAVAAALANPERRPRRLLLTEEAKSALAARVAGPWPVETEIVERGRIAALVAEDSVHQGAALLADPLVPPPLDEALARSAGPVLVLDQVTDPRNVGAILRSAAAFGAAAVVLQERHAPPETGVLARAASGALEVVPVLRAVNLARTLEALKKAELWVVGLDAAATGTLAEAGLSDRRVALVLGAEGEGLRRLTREGCDLLTRLPIAPEMESLNVAAAAAVALYELARR
ncbi:RNA methyltransferase [Roseomonas sp. NAR14]|uniref:RNA methyltransferase n=1 Tax=Roseomonas acroporae TaxID=2937791 RepID=A0A9X2BZN7_9PROT|nr:RNA methyltransferase [Roseomonas acroporae]MCK8788144.1 RNA methyltransferase [Roseomonas acroporae]